MTRGRVLLHTTRYAITAGSCLVLHNLIMICADWAGLSLLEAAATSFCIMVVVGYLMLCAFVFREPRSWARFVRYTGAMALNFPVSTALLWVFFVPLRQPMAIAAPAATIVMVALNYVASHWAIAGVRTAPSAGA